MATARKYYPGRSCIKSEYGPVCGRAGGRWPCGARWRRGLDGLGKPQYSAKRRIIRQSSRRQGAVYVASTGDTPGQSIRAFLPTSSPPAAALCAAIPLPVTSQGRVSGRTPEWPELLTESRPAYQNAVESAFPLIARNHRGVPDVAFDPDPPHRRLDLRQHAQQRLSSWRVRRSNWYIYWGTSLPQPE